MQHIHMCVVTFPNGGLGSREMKVTSILGTLSAQNNDCIVTSLNFLSGIKYILHVYDLTNKGLDFFLD